MNRSDIAKIWLTDEAVWIELNNGQRASERFDKYSRLRNANQNQRENYQLSFFGIHWPEIDEDLSYDGFFHK